MQFEIPSGRPEDMDRGESKIWCSLLMFDIVRGNQIQNLSPWNQDLKDMTSDSTLHSLQYLGHRNLT